MPARSATRRGQVGLWLVGACGCVGATTALGVAALRKRSADPVGLVTCLPALASARLVDPGQLVIGGHEIRSETLLDSIRALHRRAGLFRADLIDACAPALRSMQRNIRPGTLCGVGKPILAIADRAMPADERCPAAVVERLSADIAAMRDRRRLDHVIVVYVGSTEPRPALRAAHARFSALRRALARRGSTVLPASSLYALAAVEAGCPFINFTPSLGISVPAIQERARALGVPFMGNDGKTGETLVKSILAPMFAMRHLNVLSWTGQNILGNRDGAVLRDPRTRAAKMRGKDKTVAKVLGYAPTTHVSIDYARSLDDWKVAWDFIHFEGFLCTKMHMQFTWYGSDSALAAPLVIDLARLASLEARRGAAGPMRHLACFFKDPIDVREHDYTTQWRALVRHVVG